jgi:hypothetical protein
MLPVAQRPCKPLVIGIPRGGFSLYSSVIAQLIRVFPPKGDLKHNVLTLFVRGLNDVIASAIRDIFARRGLSDRMIYNKNFQADRWRCIRTGAASITASISAWSAREISC